MSAINPAFENNRQANLIGSLWMVFAMATFAIEDSFVKAAASQLPTGQILTIFGFGGAIILAALLLINKQQLFSPDVLSPPMIIRFFFEVSGRLFYVLAIALTPLSAATVILQATPIVVVLGATWVFREKVGWRRWVAIFVGLLGVLIIVRPGSDSFNLLSILAVLGTLGFAGRDLASRAAPATLNTSILGVYGFLAAMVAGLIVSLWEATPFVVPDRNTALYLFGATLIGVIAYSALMKAMRTGAVSAVTPFRFTRLIFGLGLGVLWFSEELSPAMLLGCGLIVLSGLFILGRGQQMKQE